MDAMAKRIAAIIFYGSLTLLPTLVWIIANFYQHISYMVLALLTVMPMFVFHAIRGILEEGQPVPQEIVTPIPG